MGDSLQATDFDTVTLVAEALRHESPYRITDILKEAARLMNAVACFLWQVAPGSRLDANPPVGHLFLVAHWTESGQKFPQYDLPLKSAAGQAILDGYRPKNIPNAQKDPCVYTGKGTFITEEGIGSFCSIPLRDFESLGGALNFYRRSVPAFSEADMERAVKLASLVVALYTSLRDKQTTILTSTIKHLQDQAERDIDKSILTQNIAEAVAGAFHCQETSIFLEDRLKCPGEYAVLGTTDDAFISASKYKKDKPGITGWVLAKRESVRIFDLAMFDEDPTVKSKGIMLGDHVREAVSRRRQEYVDRGETPPPQTLMAVPIVLGDDVLGMIRCFNSLSEPYHFSDRELQLLEAVAAQIARYWQNSQQRREMDSEIQCWHQLIEGIKTLNEYVHTELSRSAPDHKTILRECLRVAAEVVPKAEVTDVRLLGPGDQQLRFAETYGHLWSTDDSKVVDDIRKKTFSLDDPATSVSAWVVQNCSTRVVPDVSTESIYDTLFPNARSLIIAPVIARNKVVGVLDICSVEDGEFPRYADMIASLLGQQIGLYHKFTSTVCDLRDTERKTLANAKVERQTFEDLQHQLKGPIQQVEIRLRELLQESAGSANELEIKRCRGLAGKSRRVAERMGVFAELARGHTITADLSKRLHCDTLVMLLIEACSDTELQRLNEPTIHLDVERETFRILDRVEVFADRDWLEQCVYNLLDNAVKYSNYFTTVRVFGGLTKDGSFHITVANRGIHLMPEEVDHVIERGFRGNEAKRYTGEGSGIGLWMVDHIMRAQKGKLEVRPTIEGVTEVRLLFPRRLRPTKEVV